MRKIGFKNFKRFEEFSPIDISPITMLVGANNAGKSTFLQGVLLANKNISNLEIPRSHRGSIVFNGFENPLFSFDLSEFDLDIFSYDNLINYNHKGEEMTFVEELHFCDYNESGEGVVVPNETRYIITIKVAALDNNTYGDSKGKVTELEVEDRANLIRIRYNFKTKKMFFDMLTVGTEMRESEFYREEARERNKYEREGNKNILQGPFYISSKRRSKVVNLLKTHSSCVLGTFEMPLTDKIKFLDGTWGVNTKTAIGRYIENMFLYLADELEKKYTPNEDISVDEQYLEKIKEKRILDIRNSAQGVEQAIYENANNSKNHSRIINVHTHSVKRTPILDVRDKNDFLAQTIDRYNSFASISPDNQAKMKAFVLNWMQEDKFDIGTDFSFYPQLGNAPVENPDSQKFYAAGIYSPYIKGKNGEWHLLNDQGTGAIQIMTLLLNLACACVRDNALVIIEEPEQNLHPKFQSLLADVFADVYAKHAEYYDLRIIVETHSEYLIRKAQLLVVKEYSSEELKEKNPFRVYYFPVEGMPYQPNSEKPMGKGFLDEAAILSLKVLKASQKK